MALSHDPAPSRSRLKRTPTWQILAAMLLLSYGYVWHNPGPNEQSRLNLAYAIVFHGTLRVDEYCDNTIDMALYKGHYYCDKAPGLSFAAAPVLWAIRPIYARVVATKAMRFLLTVYVPRLLALSLPCAAFAVVLFLFFRRAGASEPWAVVLALAYGLGTLALPYSALFYGHQLGAALGFSAFALLVVTRQRPDALWPCATAGLLAGCAVVVEYPMAAVGAILAGYVMWTRPRPAAVMAYAGAALTGVAVLMAYNYACFDNPFTLAYVHEKTERFRAHHREGVAGLSALRWRHFLDATVSPRRGVFFRSPFLLFAAAGWGRMVKSRQWRAEAVVSMLVLAVFLVFVSSLWEESYTHAPGHRHMIPALPFVAFALVFCPGAARPWVAGLAVVSIVQMTVINFVDPRAPETMGLSLPFFQLFAPRFLAGQLDYNWGAVMRLPGLLSTLPFWLGQAGLAAMLKVRVQRGNPEIGRRTL